MKVVIFGAAGRIGSEILAEALRRGLLVRAVTHNSEIPAHAGLESLKSDITNVDSVERAVQGCDAIISAYSPGLGRIPNAQAEELIVKAHQALLAGATRAHIGRLVIIGGVGSLKAQNGVDVVDSPDYPPQQRWHASLNREILRKLQRGDHDIDWTYISPPLHIAAGSRTGHYRRGEDSLLVDAEGQSRISTADFAIAVIDELLAGKSIRRRMTVAY